MKAARPFWYLATPYTRHPGGVEVAHERACQAAARCFQAGILVFSPIAHTHAVARLGGLNGGFETWAEFDRAMIAASAGLIVLMDDGWQESTGIRAEIAVCREMGKPIHHWVPGLEFPSALLMRDP